MTDPHPPSRRAMLAAALVGGGAAAAALAGAPAAQAVPGEASGRATAKNQFTLTVLGTTDLHGNVFNWDYFKNAEYDDTAAQRHRHRQGRDPDQRACARSAARPGDPDPRRRRHHPGHAAGLLLRQDRADHRRRAIHPMAAAMNAIGYDAAALGNHEFNYGIEILRTFESQLDFPLLGANARRPRDQAAGLPAVRHQDGSTSDQRPTLKVGILGLTNPGHRDLGQGQRRGQDRVPRPGRAGQEVRPRARRRGADVVIVARHSGADTSLVVRRRAALPGERRHPGRRAGARHRRDPGRPRPRGDPAALRHEQGDRASRCC